MKNRNENTTIIQFSYRRNTIFDLFFNPFTMKPLVYKKSPFKGAFRYVVFTAFLS